MYFQYIFSCQISYSFDHFHQLIKLTSKLYTVVCYPGPIHASIDSSKVESRKCSSPMLENNSIVWEQINIKLSLERGFTQSNLVPEKQLGNFPLSIKVLFGYNWTVQFIKKTQHNFVQVIRVWILQGTKPCTNRLGPFQKIYFFSICGENVISVSVIIIEHSVVLFPSPTSVLAHFLSSITLSLKSLLF